MSTTTETPDLNPVEDIPSTSTSRKKRRNKMGGRKKSRAATGFEEYYADAPTTPQEALREQQELYSRHANTVPFEQRIQTCIHRYRNTRKLDSENAAYFHEYMFLGGIDTNGAPFNNADLEEGSLIPHAHAATTAANEEDASAASSSRFYDGNTRNWAVDFTSVVAGFLSISILPLTGRDPEPTEKAVSLVENFLRYVLQHDACPEHADDIERALQVCARARDEWPRLWRFTDMLPGRFQMAAAQTFGVHAGCCWSSREDDCNPSSSAAVPLRSDVLFYASLVAAGEPVAVEQGESGGGGLRLARQFTCSLELQRVEMPSDKVADHFRRLAVKSEKEQLPHSMMRLQPLGRAIFRPTTIEDGWVRQVSPDSSSPPPVGEDEEVVFFFERDILAEMTVGIKVTARVCELSSGFRFVEAFDAVKPSFYTFLPQHLMKGFKPPQPNDRVPRSIHDAVDFEQGGEDAEQGGEDDE